ncbi:MAG TPA: periplasmic heavy metal sensor [Terriglobales bacterium]|nr:periplasmic heavy metal sensor [Terriglobales bacterium]
MKMSPYLAVCFLFIAGAAAAQTDTPTPDKPRPERRMRIHEMPGGMPGMPELGHDWWRNSDLAQKIGLNDSQKQQLNDTFSKYRAGLIQMRGNVEIEEGKLGDLLDQDQPPQDKVLKQMADLQAARNAMEMEFTKMTLAFRGVLTPDQWKQLQTMTRQNRMYFKMRRPGPGGPGGDGPPPQPPPSE